MRLSSISALKGMTELEPGQREKGRKRGGGGKEEVGWQKGRDFNCHLAPSLLPPTKT